MTTTATTKIAELSLDQTVCAVWCPLSHVVVLALGSKVRSRRRRESVVECMYVLYTYKWVRMERHQKMVRGAHTLYMFPNFLARVCVGYKET